MDTTQVIVYVTVFLAATSLAFAGTGSWLRRDQLIQDRLSGLSQRRVSNPPGTLGSVRSQRLREEKAAARRVRLASWLWTTDAEDRRRLQTRLLNAGIYSPIALPVFLAVKIVLTFAPLLVVAVLSAFGWIDLNVWLIYGSVLGAAGLILPALWLREKKRKWHAVITSSLADFLDLMVACLEVGLSTEAALQRVTDELKVAHPRLSAELSVVQAQIELGAPSDVALKNFADRSDCDAIRSVAVVVQHGRRVGGGMAEIFRQQAESLRVRREYEAEEKAQQAAVKIVLPTLLFIFPVIFVVLAGPAVIRVAALFGGSSSNALH